MKKAKLKFYTHTPRFFHVGMMTKFGEIKYIKRVEDTALLSGGSAICYAVYCIE